VPLACNLGTLTSWNPLGHSRPATGRLCLFTCVTSGLSREGDKNCALLGHYAAYGAHSLPTFRYNISVPSSRVKKSKKKGFLDLLNTGPIGCPDTSVRNDHHTLHNMPEGCGSQHESCGRRRSPLYFVCLRPKGMCLPMCSLISLSLCTNCYPVLWTASEGVFLAPSVACCTC
jgi:hypothetical protein